MEKKRFVNADGWSFTYSPTETEITEISTTRLVEYAITGGFCFPIKGSPSVIDEIPL